MTPLDVALIIGIALAAALPWTPLRASRPLLGGTAVAVLALLVAQVVRHGVRWQLVPLIGAVATVTLLGSTGLRTTAVPRARIAGTTVAGTLAVLGGFALWAAPTLQLPEPSGPHAVGTVVIDLTDPDRAEAYGPAPGGPRRFPVQVYYPAAPGPTSQRADWLTHPEAIAAVIADEYQLPGFALAHLAATPSHALHDAPVANGGPFPLVVYSHGWSGLRALHAPQMMSLASHGYVVAVIDHTYGATATVFDDGEVVALDPSTLPVGAEPQIYEDAAVRLVATFAADIELVVDALADLLDAPLAAAVDRTRTGVLGHSTGGGAAVLACSRNRWCAATVTYDPWVEPVPDDVVGAGLQVPMLSIRSEEWLDTPNDRRLRRLHAGTDAPEGRLAIEGTAHRDFTVLPLLSPLSGSVGLTGATPGHDTLAIIDDATIRFLEHHLRGRGADPLRLGPSDPRVTLARAEERR